MGNRDRYPLLMRLLFVFSAVCMTMLLSRKGSPVPILCGVACALILLSVCALRFRLLETLLSRVGCVSAAMGAVLALYASHFYAQGFGERLFRFGEELGNAPALTAYLEQNGVALAIPVGILALPALFVFLAAFLSGAMRRIDAFLRASDRHERWFLLACAVLSAVLIVATYGRTSVFYAPNIESQSVWDKVDIVYTSDTCALVETDVYRNVAASENDVRQPLFGVFSAPFALFAGLVSELFFFVPNAYAILMATVQAWLILVCVALWARMTAQDRLDRIPVRLAFLFLYPTLLFMLNLEQYAFAVFYLTLLIDGYVRNSELPREIIWTAAAGSMLTSGAAILLVPREEGFGKRYLRACLRACLTFLAVLVVFGRLPLLLLAVANLRTLAQFSGGGVPFIARLMQYVNFIGSCLVSPQSEVVLWESGVASYQMCAVTGFNPLGWIVLALASLGFALNRRDRFSRVCACWIALSFVILCLVGWGTAENGLMLYTFYYGWAFFALIVKGVERVCLRAPRIRRGLYALASLTLLVLSVRGLAALIRFGLQYYPLG